MTKKYKDFIDESSKNVFRNHKMHVEVNKIKNTPYFEVKSVGKDVNHVKIGDKITSSDLDDLHETGHKVKEKW